MQTNSIDQTKCLETTVEQQQPFLSPAEIEPNPVRTLCPAELLHVGGGTGPILNF